MRWLFHNPDNPTEAERHQAVLESIRQWWAAFQAKESDLLALFANRADWDLPGWVRKHLNAVDDRLMWEFGGDADGTHYLTITPESHHQLRPLVRTLLEMAPHMPGWVFRAYRPPTSLADTVALVASRAGGDIAGGLAEARLGQGRLIDLVYRLPGCSGTEDEHAQHQAFVTTECLLGEELLDKWVGHIEVASPPSDSGQAAPRVPTGAVPLESFKERVIALHSAAMEQLPAEPLCSEDLSEEPWSVIELEADARDDYPARLDLVSAATCQLEMWRAAHCGAPFYSERFSRVGETFAYLKLERASQPENCRWDDLDGMETDLGDRLARQRAGCVVGWGTGVRYSYLDLALADLRRAIEIICPLLAAGNVSRRSWLMFFDADLAEEWVGIYPDSPAPPAR